MTNDSKRRSGESYIDHVVRQVKANPQSVKKVPMLLRDWLEDNESFTYSVRFPVPVDKWMTGSGDILMTGSAGSVTKRYRVEGDAWPSLVVMANGPLGQGTEMWLPLDMKGLVWKSDSGTDRSRGFWYYEKEGFSVTLWKVEEDNPETHAVQPPE